MLVYKFGGASVADPSRMAALLPILKENTQPVLIVISALGKTTNALENIVNHACRDEKPKAQWLASMLEQQHLDYARRLLKGNFLTIATKVLNNYFAELNEAVLKADTFNYDFSYDQIVGMGEIFSSCLFSNFLLQNDIKNEWVDARLLIRTDDTYRDAIVDYEYSLMQAKQLIEVPLLKGLFVVTQGFIGATEAGNTTTLGREGSDYSAAIIAAMLNAESVTIWKDVEGLLNADPKLFPNTIKIDRITYKEVIEMAFFGAQIIHPKTIKPLQNNNIPLYIKCFFDKDKQGTIITDDVEEIAYPPIIVLKENQILIQVITRDFSFITEENLSKLYEIFHILKIKINLIQNAAISFIACIDNREDKVKSLIHELSKNYKVLNNDNVSLLTIRHYNTDIITELTKNRNLLLQQITRKTMQVVMK